jgi:hypothetical protein
MIEILVHPAGTKVLIDRDNHRIGTLYPKDTDVRDWSDLSNPLWADTQRCRVCQKPLDDTRLAFAYWKHEKALCSTECFAAERLNRHACCEQAKPLSRNCVCDYATECPIHGERHFGTHD